MKLAELTYQLDKSVFVGVKALSECTENGICETGDVEEVEEEIEDDEDGLFGLSPMAVTASDQIFGFIEFIETAFFTSSLLSYVEKISH